VRWAAIANLEDGSPFGESSTCLVVLLASVTKAIKTGGSTLVLGSGEGHKTLVDLDAWDDTLLLKELNERSAIGSLLV